MGYPNATSHRRLRAPGQFTLPTTLTGGKGGGSRWSKFNSQFRTALEGPTECINETDQRRLRAPDHFTLQPLSLVEKAEEAGGPSSLRTALEGPKECINARWM